MIMGRDCLIDWCECCATVGKIAFYLGKPKCRTTQYVVVKIKNTTI
jgi:hypothetical protein